MGLVFTFIGLLLIVTGAQNTYADFGNTVKGDLTGQGNFTYWMAAILMIGVLGYIPSLNRFSHWFLALILLSLFLSHKGFFSKFQAALASGPTAPNVSGSKGNAPLGSGPLGVTQGPFGNNLPSQQGGWWNWLTTPPSVEFSNPLSGIGSTPGAAPGSFGSSPQMPF